MKGRRSFLMSALAAGAAARAGAINVDDFGVHRNGRDPDTGAIQKAIEACTAAGGGTVYFPAGSYYTGGLMLRTGVHLYLEAGAVLHGSTRLADFPVTRPRIHSYTDNYTERSLLFGEGLENVGIHGEGVIDGHGAAYEGPYKVRPYLIRLVSCKDVSISGITLRNSPMWVQHYLACDDVRIQGITVRSRVNKNNDGIDIDGCHRVMISDCNISSGDDAIVLKSTLDRECLDVAISNCVLSSRCNAFKLGTESNGGFRNVVLSNCTIHETRLSGIAIECVDGARLEGVSVSNVTMREVKNPIFIRLGNRARPFEKGGVVEKAGVLRNVRISGVSATGASDIGCAISGIPGHEIENVSIENVRLESEGGVAKVPASVPEKETGYPEHKMFGRLPGYGFYCRHVRGIRFQGVETTTKLPDARPALACDEVEQLEVSGSVFAATGTVLRFRGVRGALIQGCRLRAPSAVFLDAGPAGSGAVSLIGNDLSQAGQAVAGGDKVFQAANRGRGTA